VLFHHDPASDDARIAAIEREAAAALPGTIAAREGLVLQLGGGGAIAEAAWFRAAHAPRAGPRVLR
jgi:hypothetical protein